MARIRTVKPEFFRHEGLQDLERDHPGSYPMLVFVGLFGHCDKGGVFEWKPRVLKLDILPFLDFDMAETLDILEQAGQVQKFEAEGKTYGFIPTFTEHQSISGKESQAPVKFPRPAGETLEHGKGSDREGSGTPGREGKGMESTHSVPRQPARGCRLPEDFSLTQARRAVANSEGIDPDRTFAKFCDYWRGAPGAKGVKLDWEATWRNWCRSEGERNPRRPAKGGADNGLPFAN